MRADRTLRRPSPRRRCRSKSRTPADWRIRGLRVQIKDRLGRKLRAARADRDRRPDERVRSCETTDCHFESSGDDPRVVDSEGVPPDRDHRARCPRAKRDRRSCGSAGREQDDAVRLRLTKGRSTRNRSGQGSEAGEASAVSRSAGRSVCAFWNSFQAAFRSHRAGRTRDPAGRPRLRNYGNCAAITRRKSKSPCTGARRRRTTLHQGCELVSPAGDGGVPTRRRCVP